MLSLMALTLGHGTLMVKFDVASVYRNVAIHHDDRPLLGMQWCGQYCIFSFIRRSIFLKKMCLFD